jgi:hypothetical protein
LNIIKSYWIQVLTVVSIESYIFWDIMLFSPVKVNQFLGGIYYFHIQDPRVSLPGAQHEAGAPEGGGDIFFRNID